MRMWCAHIAHIKNRINIIHSSKYCLNGSNWKFPFNRKWNFAEEMERKKTSSQSIDFKMSSADVVIYSLHDDEKKGKRYRFIVRHVEYYFLRSICIPIVVFRMWTEFIITGSWANEQPEMLTWFYINICAFFKF